VAAAGGDGTVGAVAAGLHGAAAAGVSPPPLAILPIGTGNDFARHFGLPTDALEALRAARAAAAAGAFRRVDLVRCESAQRPGESAWALNAVVGGLGGRIGDAIDAGLRRRWGRLVYLRAGLADLLRHPAHAVRLRVDERRYDLDAIMVVVAGGRYAGGGIPFAPAADPCDGRLDVTVVRRTALPRLPATVLGVLRGDPADADNLLHLAGRRVAIEAGGDFWLNLDGETWTSGSARFEIVPGAIRLAVPPAPAPPAGQRWGRARRRSR